VNAAPRIAERALLCAGLLTGAAALLHVAIIVGGPAWYRFFGAGERMARLAARGSAYPTLVTADHPETPTHLVLYRAFSALGGVVHTHSHYATVWAQAGREIPCMGTTHADYFHGPVPITASMADDEIASKYEENTGHAIVRRFSELDPTTMPAVLVAGHASFCWGPTVTGAVQTASILETVARMAYDTAALNPGATPIATALLDKHFLRKHGKNAYYGQPTAV